MNLKVVEIFPSIQGEGSWVGTSATFIRLGLCNLSCVWCDTDFSKFQEMSISEIMFLVRSLPAKHIVITGGEPILQIRPLVHLVHDLRMQGYKVGVETNGTQIFDTNIFHHITVSPKEGVEMVNENQQCNRKSLLGICDDLKLIDQGQTLSDLDKWTQRIVARKGYYLQPLSNDSASIRRCADLIASQSLWKLSLQTHKMIGMP